MWLAMSVTWGQGTSTWPVVKGSAGIDISRGIVLDLEAVERERPEECTQTLLGTELDGDILAIGPAFWGLLKQRSAWLRHCLEQGNPSDIEYSDRYVRCPLSARVLFEILKPFASDGSERSNLMVSTTSCSPMHNCHAFHHDWRDGTSQKAILQSVFSRYFNAKTTVVERSYQLTHARFLSLAWPNGNRVEINLDQGVGFLRTKTYKNFDFAAASEVQASKLTQVRFSVANQSNPMPIYIMKPE